MRGVAGRDMPPRRQTMLHLFMAVQDLDDAAAWVLDAGVTLVDYQLQP